MHSLYRYCLFQSFLCGYKSFRSNACIIDFNQRISMLSISHMTDFTLPKTSSLLSVVESIFAASMTFCRFSRSNGSHCNRSFGMDWCRERISSIACFARDSDLAPTYTLAPCNASCLTVSSPRPELIRCRQLGIGDWKMRHNSLSTCNQYDFAGEIRDRSFGPRHGSRSCTFPRKHCPENYVINASTRFLCVGMQNSS